MQPYFKKFNHGEVVSFTGVQIMRSHPMLTLYLKALNGIILCFDILPFNLKLFIS